MSPALDAMIDVIAEMTHEFGGPPTLAELAEVIGWSTATDDDRLVSTVVPPALRAGPDTRPSRVGTLNDSSFVLASGLITKLLDEHAGEQTITDADLVPHLNDLLARVPPGLLVGGSAFTLVGTRARRRPKPGDVVAIPSAHGGHHVAVVLGKNRFGTAFGLFVERQAVPRAPGGRVLGHAVYSGDTAIMSGRWLVVGHDEALLSLFPADPEIYHWIGIAETAAGATRQVPDEELERVGIFDRSYSQVYSEEYLEQQLDSGRILRA